MSPSGITTISKITPIPYTSKIYSCNGRNHSGNMISLVQPLDVDPDSVASS